MKRKRKINYYLEIFSIFSTIVFLNLLGLLTINIGCKALNPAFTAGTDTSEQSSTTESSSPITSSSTTSLTTTPTSSSTSTTGSSTASNTTSTSSTSNNFTTTEMIGNMTTEITSGPTSTTGILEGCGDCRIDELTEDCDICTSQFEIGMCTNTCDIQYDVQILEHDLALYCDNFNYCGEPECGQCEADAVCYILHYKYLVNHGFLDVNKQKLQGVGWFVQEIDPTVTVTLTYENIPNSFLIPNNGAKILGYNGDIWLSEKPYYLTGKAMQNVSCSLVNL